jgi:hypothetical protein
MAVPAMGKRLWPVVVIRRPETTEAVNMPAISGSSSRPDCVGETPRTITQLVSRSWGSLIDDIGGDQAIEDARYSAPVDGRSMVGRDSM